MTRAWNITPKWTGDTVAVLASGPSMSAAVAESLRWCHTIAVKHTCRLAPWASMLVALDAPWPNGFRTFKGLRVAGVADNETDALYAGPWMERVQMGPGHVIEIRNSGLAAIRIAAAMGAKGIVLAGFDPHQPGRWHDPAPTHYAGLAEGLAALCTELKARGIEVRHV
jgi:hypothetical protein